MIDEELLEEEPLPFEEPEMEPDDEDLEIDEAEEVEKIFKESTIAEEEDFRPLEVDIEDREDDDLIWRPDDAEQESHETAETVIEKKKPKKKIKKSKLKKNVTRKI